MKKFKLGIDIHGVIDSDPMFFSELTNMLYEVAEIHIITGSEFYEVEKQLKDWDIKFHHFFSIVGYHNAIGTPIVYDKNANIWLDDELWDRTKGDYCKDVGITVHIDDTLRYKDFMPDTTYFYHYTKNSNENIM